MRLYKYKLSFVILIILLFSFTAVASDISEYNINEDNEEVQDIMNEILNSANDIMLSKPNVTVATQLLAALPEREHKPSIAVYHIGDRTGQVKELGSSVVTQGATDMMITALQRSRQFRVLGRVNFSDFMNEQNLITGDRIAAGEGPTIGEISGADYIIEGSITEYQVDTTSGGIGVSIGGIGGTNEKAVASTAIDLRLLDTTSGEVVWAQSLKGEIEGKKVGLQAFSFMGNNIVEFETGKGKQEVINLMVRTLIEEAVFNLANSNI